MNTVSTPVLPLRQSEGSEPRPSPAAVRGQRRAELAAFLRSRRALIGPEDAGLAPGLRRRTPGLRREEVAQLAGVGVTWYTWLEQGRPINASPQVLDAVATVLKLDRAAHAHLYRLADVPEVPPAIGDGQNLPPDLQEILDSFVGKPACVYNGKYDLLAWNVEYAALFPTMTSPGRDRNALWYCFVGDGAENPLGNRELLEHMVAIARSAYARHVGEPEWTEWVRRLSAASPDFAQMWASNRVSESVPSIKEFGCFGLGIFHARTTSFGITGAPETRMVLYLPQGPSDHELLERLKRRLEKLPQHSGASTSSPNHIV
ncbi:MAG: transcriptional regulator, family [Pseudonocardiales bacterium]|nr:transcriptional regulator, family [Pseudonocardiales bacterium]